MFWAVKSVNIVAHIARRNLSKIRPLHFKKKWSEVFDDKGLHKNKKCVFFNFLWYRNVRVGRCSISLLICSFRFHSNCWENTVYGNHSAFSKNYQLLAYTLLGLSDAVVKLLNIAFCFWHLPPRDHNPFSWNVTKFS